ncbi:MAG: class I SAM-dependent methyltransferase [Bacilli bacterium]|nr:class I SAM-dependent methyltransferase [Bacilli bacterium]
MEEKREKEYVDSVYAGPKENEDVYAKFMEITKKGVILDLGCGIGPASNYLNEFGYDCIGYDIEEYHLNMGKKYKPELKLYLGNMIDIPTQSVKANGAVYAYCLQNLKDEEIIKSFNSCRDNLVDDGTILIFNISRLEWEPSFFINALDKEKIEMLLTKCSFKIKYIEYVDENIIAVIASKK